MHLTAASADLGAQVTVGLSARPGLMRAPRTPGSRCEVMQALCFRGDGEGALGEDWLAEHAAATDREGVEDGAGRGVDQVGAGAGARGAAVGAARGHPGT